MGVSSGLTVLTPADNISPRKPGRTALAMAKSSMGEAGDVAKAATLAARTIIFFDTNAEARHGRNQGVSS